MEPASTTAQHARMNFFMRAVVSLRRAAFHPRASSRTGRVKVRTADRAPGVLLGDLTGLSHGKLPRLVVIALDGISRVRGMERHRRPARALVNRDEDALGPAAQASGGGQCHLVPPTATAAAVITAAEAAAATAA